MAKNKEKAGAGKTIVIFTCGFCCCFFTAGAYGYGVHYFFQSFSSRLYGEWI